MTDPIGVDIGGTSMRATRGTRVDDRMVRVPVHRTMTLSTLLAHAGRLLDTLDPHRRAPVVVAVPTFVGADGSLLDTPSLPALTGVRLAAEMAVQLGRPAPSVVPDLAAAVVAEARLGSGRGVDRFLCVALGTGANAAATRGGRLIDTAFGCLGDAGHVLVDPDGPRCPCGGRGCLEAVASGWALNRDATQLGLAGAAELAPAADGGDTRARAVIDRAGIALGRAISTWSVLLWPETVAIAGGVAALGDRLLAPARHELDRVGPTYVTGRIRVVPAELADRATVIGAILLAAGAPESGSKSPRPPGVQAVAAE